MKFGQNNNGDPFKNLWRIIPGVLVSLVAILALFNFVNFGSAWAVIRTVKIWQIIFVALFTVFFLAVRAIGWKALLGEKATYKETFLKLSEGYFVNNIFPLRMGEISRAIFMGVTMQVNPAQILSSIVVERVFDLMIMATFLVILIPVVLDLQAYQSMALIILAVMIFGLITLYFIARNQEKVKKILGNLGQRVPMLNRFLLPIFYSLLDGFQTLRSPIQFVIGFFGVLGSWLVSMVQYSAFLIFMVKDAGWWWGVAANTALALGIALPSAPAGLGLFEGSLVAALKVFGIDESIGLAYALVLHVVQFIVTGAIGLYALYRDGNSVKGLFSRLTQQKQFRKNPINPGVGHE